MGGRGAPSWNFEVDVENKYSSSGKFCPEGSYYPKVECYIV